MLNCDRSIEPTHGIANLDFLNQDGLSIQKGEVEIFTTANEYLVFFNAQLGDKTMYVLQADNPAKMGGVFEDVEFSFNEQFFLFNPVNSDKLYVFVLSDYKGIEDFSDIDGEVVLIKGYGVGTANADFSNLLSTLRTEFIESVYLPHPNTGL